MNERHQNGQIEQQCLSHLPPLYCQSDDVDLKALIMELWQEKVILIAIALIALFGATIYAWFQPNVYQSSGTLLASRDFYGSILVKEPHLSAEFMNGYAVKSQVADLANVELSKIQEVSITYNSANKLVTISKSSNSSEEAYKGVKIVYDNLNSALKKVELDRVTLSTSTAEILKYPLPSIEVKNNLSSIYAQQLYKKAMLGNPESKLLEPLAPPFKPSGHIAPKRLLISVLGGALGLVFGITFVLTRGWLRKTSIL